MLLRTRRRYVDRSKLETATVPHLEQFERRCCGELRVVYSKMLNVRISRMYIAPVPIRDSHDIVPQEFRAYVDRKRGRSRSPTAAETEDIVYAENQTQLEEEEARLLPRPPVEVAPSMEQPPFRVGMPIMWLDKVCERREL